MKIDRTIRACSRRRGGATTLLATLALTFALPIAGCRSGPERLSAESHELYFNPQSSCISGFVPKEVQPEYLLFYQQFRQQRFGNVETGAELLIVGESTAALFNPILLPELRTVNRGIPGETTLMLIQRLESDVIAARPQAVLIAIGGNDLLEGRCIPEIVRHTRTILQTLRRELPRSRIILASVPPVNTARANTISPYFNQQIRAMAAEESRIEFMDLWPILADPNRPWLREEFLIQIDRNRFDAVHFNEAGYRAWADLIRKTLK